MKIRQSRDAFEQHRNRCRQCSYFNEDPRQGMCTKGQSLWRTYMSACLAAGKRGLMN